MTRARWRSLTIDVAVIVALLAGIGLWRTWNHPRGPAPKLTLPVLDGGSLALSTLAGRPTLLVFAAPWCGVCKATAQNVRWLQGLAGDRIGVVAIVSAYDDEASVRAYVAEHGPPGPVLLDRQGMAAQAFGVTAFPTFFFLDGSGEITGSTVGYTTTAGLLARLFL
jgi:thiol-disulfide isomerase/thioredoxin